MAGASASASARPQNGDSSEPQEEPPSGLENGGPPVSPAASVPGEQWVAGGVMDRSASYQLSPAAQEAGVNGNGGEAGANGNGMTREKSYQTLADLKRQRAAAKLNKYPAPAPPLLPSPVEEEPPGTEEEEGGGGGGGGDDAPGEVVRREPTGDQTTITMTTGAAVVSTSSQVYFTPASGDPPLLKLRAPEEEQSTAKEPCCRLM